MHEGLGNILDDDWDIKVPSADCFIVGRSHETSILVDECNRVDWAQVLVVFLRDLARIHIILYQTVRTASVVLGEMKFT